MRVVVDTVPKSTLECDLIDFMTMHCPLSKTDCDIWRLGECCQLISFTDCFKELNEESASRTKEHTHDT